ncbi:hypothetical protein EC968_001166 [Mortierella alpina]|nr:hypothetical protein EC968_001166 [Mortierella alpina]
MVISGENVRYSKSQICSGSRNSCRFFTRARRQEHHGAPPLLNTFVHHEQVVRELVQQPGITHTSPSIIMPKIKMAPSGTSATANAYLTLSIKTYVDGSVRGFDET